MKGPHTNKMMVRTFENKSGVVIGGVQPGAEVNLDCDCDGTPKSHYWRRRAKDSEIDGSLEDKAKTTKKGK